MKVSILALSVLVGGAVFASAADSVIIGSTSDVYLTNTPAPLIWSEVYRLPTSALLNPERGISFEAAVVDTDDGGKISGAGNIIKRYYGNATDTNAVTAISSWYTTVKGSIKASKMATPSVDMTIKGEGYLAPGTNTTIILNGQNADAFPGKFNLKFTAKNTPAISNNFAYHILGNLKGTITPAVKGAKQQKVDEVADLVVSRNAMDTLDMRVIVSGKKFAAILWDTDATGTGSIDKNNKYSVTLKPVSGGSSSLKLKGELVAVTSSPYTNITTINTADITGKIQGQAVESKGYKFGGFWRD